MAKTGKIEIKLVRGLSGKRKDQIEIVKSLGLSKVNQIKIHPDNEATKGKVNKVNHLVNITKIWKEDWNEIKWIIT